MEIPPARWYEAIPPRRSRRQFDNAVPVSATVMDRLSSVCREFHPFPHARAVLVTESVGEIFRGIVGGYGKISGAAAFIAFIGNMKSNSVQEEVGYTGEGIILEASALGLGTCWVGGFFKPEVVNKLVTLQPDEKVLAVTPVGYTTNRIAFFEKLMTGFERSHHRLPLSRLVTDMNGFTWPEGLKASLEAARLAPSAINRQPWGFSVGKDNVTVYVRSNVPDFSVSKRLDCGIAMLHIEAAALKYGIKGAWELLPAPQVARFSF